MNNKRANNVTRQWLAGFLLGLISLGVSSMATATSLTNVEYSALKGSQVEVRLQFDGSVPNMDSYSIEQPARIALDLLDTSSNLKQRNHRIDSDPVRSLTVVEAKDRTRVIVNLSSLTGYDTQVDGTTLVLKIGGKDDSPAVFEVAEEEAASAQSGDVRNIDFRRGSDGEGRVIVNLAKTSTPVDVREERGRLVVKFLGATTPRQLRKRLDVTDFGTPVNHVETRQEDGSTVMTIEAAGEWEYLAYQADTAFSIDVKPLKADAKDIRKDKFEYTGDKLSLNFQNIEMRSVLQLIADFTGLNLVASDTVSGSITLRLQNVPWDQALDLILKTKGLDKRQVGNVLLVAPAAEISAREKQELESQQQLESLAPLRTEYIRINYAVARDMEALIKAESSTLLSSRGSVAVDERTNTLIVNDVAQKVEEIRAQAREVTAAAVAALGLDDCAVNIDLMACDGRVYVIELTGRAGANGLPELMGAVYGLDYYELVAREALDLDVPGTWARREPGPGAALARMLTAPDAHGTIADVLVPGALPDWAVDLSLFRGPGDRIDGFASSNDCLGQLVVRGQDLSQCRQRAAALAAQVTFRLQEAA